MATTTAFKTKKYVADQLKTLLNDYERLLEVTYGLASQQELATTVQVLDISWESTEPYSSGSTRKINQETYRIKCFITVRQADGSQEDVELTLEDIYSIIEDFIRDDLMNTKLGGNVAFANCLPSSVLSGPMPQGAGAYMEFDIECTAKVR